jgi:hypothetical protein
MEGELDMEGKLFEIEDVKSVFKKFGFNSEECDQCMQWTSAKLDVPLIREDAVLAELSPEEESFLRCMDYMSAEKVVDTLRLTALHETFWSTVRSQHDLPLTGLAVKEGKFVVAM